MTDRQQADFERYMHIVPHKIAKYAPDFIGNEDFEQDCYLHMAEYLASNDAIDDIKEQYARRTRISNNMTAFIKNHANQWSDEPSLALWEETPEPFDYVRKNEICKNIQLAIDMLPNEKQRTIIRGYFGFETGEEMTFAELGACIGMSDVRVFQIKNKAIRLLRNPNAYAGELIRKTFHSKTTISPMHTHLVVDY